jgi:Zn-finger nucleic acid-binding protein
MTDRQGVEIDYCPKCRGVWLDRGELDKLLEHAATSTTPHQRALDAGRSGQRSARDFEDSDHRGANDQPHIRRKSWLSEIFD